ncbi:MAG: acyl-CoA thioesterase [Candidatus Lokiarchaeota archaeon]|nr:acyl-CoA thioesterase [Candidatus Lokiarchaeota archaeon]MBD3338764.1 acyl-CoA thioesterase [Candidatus Lokiarchaeota archaeon]
MTNRPAKKVSESKVEIADIMLPEHANAAGNVHGGSIMKRIDNAAGIVAQRHTHRNVVTASVDSISFLSPAFIGNLVIAKASLNYVGKTSMEIGVRVEAESLETGNHTHIASAYLTYVALDKNDEPVEVPEIIPETDEERRRFEEAASRREERIKKRSETPKKPQACMERPEHCRTI